MRSNAYTLGFAAAVCVSCSLVISSAAILLRDRQQKNVEIDMQKNILRCVGLELEGAEGEEIGRLYRENIEELVIDRAGRVVEGRKPSDLKPEDYLDPMKDPVEFPLFVRKKDGKKLAYALPIAGKGLWSTLYGYLALEPDAKTIKGITFYKHGETPGLGAEVEKAWFQNNWKGKKILGPKGRLVSVRVVKGKAKDACPGAAAAHCVDGISGATMTSNGVTKLVASALKRYDPFLSSLRRPKKRRRGKR